MCVVISVSIVCLISGSLGACQQLQESFILRRNERKPLQGLMCVLGGISKSLRVGKCSFCLCGLALAAGGLFELNPVGRRCFTAFISLRRRSV